MRTPSLGRERAADDVVDAEPRRERHEVAVERRRHDHDPVALGAVPREPLEHLGPEPLRGPEAVGVRDAGGGDVGGGAGRRGAGRSAPPSRRRGRRGRPRPAASWGDVPSAARANATAPGDRREERHQGVAPGDRAVEVERGDRRPRVRGDRGAVTPRSQRAGAEDDPRARGAAPTSRMRSLAGAHTVSAPRPSPVTIAAATDSGSVASGAASRPWVIFEWTKPGRTTRTRTPLPWRLSPRPWQNASRPALLEPYTKFDLRARSPATDDRTTMRPWPWRRIACASGTSTDTAPV